MDVHPCTCTFRSEDHMTSKRKICPCGRGPIVYVTKGVCRPCYNKEYLPGYYQRNKDKWPTFAERMEGEGFQEKNKAYQRAYRRSHKAEVAKRIDDWRRRNLLRRASSENRRRVRMRGNFVENFSVEELVERDKSICGICGKYVSARERSIDHIVPVSANGEHSLRNTRLTHLLCNIARGAGRFPAQTRLI